MRAIRMMALIPAFISAETGHWLRLKFFGSDLAARVGLKLQIELIELLHAGITHGFRLDG